MRCQLALLLQALIRRPVLLRAADKARHPDDRRHDEACHAQDIEAHRLGGHAGVLHEPSS
jgi:hypothetical protein